MTSLRDQGATSLMNGIEALAEGDLTVRVESLTEPIENPAKDEIGQVAVAVNGVRDRFDAISTAYNTTRANLNEIVSRVAGSAGEVSAASQQMATTSDESGRATGEIANAIRWDRGGRRAPGGDDRRGKARGRGRQQSGGGVRQQRTGDGKSRG